MNIPVFGEPGDHSGIAPEEFIKLQDARKRQYGEREASRLPVNTPIGHIARLWIEDGFLILENAEGQKYVLAHGVTAAVEHDRAVFYTDGERVLRYDGETTEDVTDRFRCL